MHDVSVAVSTALPSIELAAIAFDSAVAQVGLARAAAIPRLTLAAGYTRLSATEPAALNFGGQEIDSPFDTILDNYSLTASLSVPLSEILLRALPGLDLVERAVDVRAYEQTAAEIDAVWRGTEFYHGWLRAFTARNVAAESLRILEQTLANVELLAEAGVLPTLDVITMRATVEQAATALAHAENGVVLAENAIRVFTGWDAGSPFMPGEDLLATPVGPAPSVDELVERALETRPESALFEELIAIETNRVRIQRVDAYPSLSLDGRTQYSNPNQRIVPSRAQFDLTWDVSLTLSWSPNGVLTARSQVEMAERQVDRVRAEIRGFELDVRAQATDAVAAWSSAISTIEGAQQMLRYANEEIDARRYALEGGVGTTSELLAAQGRAVAAWMDLLDGYIELRRAHALVDRIVGIRTGEM